MGDIIIVCNYELDSEQLDIVKCNKNMLVIAGAGSGKTLTIIGKVYYLIKNGIKPSDILLISFTRDTCNNLIKKIEYPVDIYTFHKLGLSILNNNGANFNITDDDTLKNIIYNFFYNEIIYNDYFKKIVVSLLKQDDYNKILNRNELIFLINDLEKFILLFKNRGYSLIDFIAIDKKIRKNFFYYSANHKFLMLALNIYLRYEAYLKDNHEIDFEDMILKSTQIIINGGYIKKYKYVIIDEFQDTSYTKFLLIDSIIKRTGAKILAVGDDFQSIYRFTGCDLNIFLNFKKYFSDSVIKKITTTYRTSDELIKNAGRFVMKNKRQIKKNLHSNKFLKNTINIVYYKNSNTILEKVILYVYTKCKSSILIIGRNNNDINMYLGNTFEFKDSKVIYLKNIHIDIEYLTAHKSKGLENENVIILNMNNCLNGFPTKIKNKRIFKYILPKIDRYKYSEERRLFYVALTRSKNYVYLLSEYKNESEFVKEIKRYNNVKVLKIN